MHARRLVSFLYLYPGHTPENDSNEILTQVIGLTCSGQTGRIHRADFDFWGLAEER